MKKKCTACNYKGTMLVRVTEGDFFYECPHCGNLRPVDYVNVVEYGNDEYSDILELMNKTDDYMFTYEHISKISKAGFDINVYLDDYRVMEFNSNTKPDYFDVEEIMSVFIYGNWIKVHVFLNEGNCSMGYSLIEE